MVLIDCWTVIGAIGAATSAAVSIPYTYFTYKLLKEGKDSREKATKLAVFQVYTAVARELGNINATQFIEQCKDNTLEINQGNASEVKRFLLNPLEDLAKFHDDELIDIESISSGYGAIILIVGNNLSIVNLVLHERIAFPTVYSGFEELYNQIYQLCSQAERANYRARLIN